MESVATSSWNRIRTTAVSAGNMFMKYHIDDDGICKMAYTDLVAVYFSSCSLRSNAEACNPSLTLDSSNVVEHLLNEAIQSCCVQNDGGATASVVEREDAIDLQFLKLVAEGVQFVWTQTLKLQPRSNELLRDHFIIPLLQNRSSVPGLPENQRQSEQGPLSPARSASPAASPHPPSVDDPEKRSGRREEWMRKKEEARKRKLMSLQ